MRKAKSNPEKTPAAEEAEIVQKSEAENQQKVVNKVGSLLKEMRLQKGLRLPDVAKRLCIRKTYLDAIEESNYKEIPAFPYGVGFIRSYAEFLGLNSENIVELYKEETNTTPAKDIYMLEPQSEATVPGRKYLIISLLGIMLVYVLWYVYNNRTETEEPTAAEVVVEENIPEDMPLAVENFAALPETDEAETSLPAEENDELSESQVTITEASFVEPAPAEPAPAEAPQKDETVVVKIIAETWIEVKDGSKLYLSKVLQPGTTYVVPEGGKGMILSVGKIEGAEVYINGKLTPVARPGKKTNIALDPFINAAH